MCQYKYVETSFHFVLLFSSGISSPAKMKTSVLSSVVFALLGGAFGESLSLYKKSPSSGSSQRAVSLANVFNDIVSGLYLVIHDFTPTVFL